MKLSLVINGVDYTEYVEKFSLGQHIDSLVQATMPTLSATISLSTVLPEDIKPGHIVSWGWRKKRVLMPIAKISRMKNTSEVWLTRYITMNPNRIMEGCMSPQGSSTNFIDGLRVDYQNLLAPYSNFYVYTPEDLFLGLANSTTQKALGEYKFPLPWGKGGQESSIAIDTPDERIALLTSIKQLQTVEEFDASPKPQVTKYSIDYDDVIEEESLSSQVDPNAVVISELGAPKQGLSFSYTGAEQWETVLNEIRLHENPQSKIFGISTVTGSGSSAKSELHMSDGAVYTVDGYVVGVSPGVIYSYRTVTRDIYGNTVTGDLIAALSYDGTVLEETSLDYQGVTFTPTYQIAQDFATKDEVIQMSNGAEIVLLGRPAVDSNGHYSLGSFRAKGESMRWVYFSDVTAHQFDGCWLLRAEPTASGASAVYAMMGKFIVVSIDFEGKVTRISSSSSGTSLPDTAYPIDAHPVGIENPTLYGFVPGDHLYTSWRTTSGYTTSYTNWVNDHLTSFYLGSFSDMGAVILRRSYAGYTNSSYKYTLYWTKEYLSDWQSNEQQIFAEAKIVPQDSAVFILGQSTFVSLFSLPQADTLRTVVAESAKMPHMTYDLKDRRLSTGNVGEDRIVRMPYLLRPVDQALSLIPTDKTRLKVNVSALSCTLDRSNSISMQGGVEAYARAFVDNPPQPLHTYYMSADILAPQGIIATKASIGFDAEDWASGVATKIRIPLENVPASADWVRHSVVQTVPSDYNPSTVNSNPMGAYSDGANNSWSFRRPLLVDLTAVFGEGNEPTKDWCDQNLDYTYLYNMVRSPELDSTIQSWGMGNASFEQRRMTEKLHIDNDDVILPQLGCPILYQRKKEDGSPHNSIAVSHNQQDSCSLYTTLKLEAGATYSLSFDYKVNLPYTTNQGNVQMHVLRVKPRRGDMSYYSIGSFAFPEQVSEGSATISFTPSNSTCYLQLDIGYVAYSNDVDVSVNNIRLYKENEDVTTRPITIMSTWDKIAATNTLTVKTTNALEEAIILGFDYKFEGKSSLWVDLLLLGYPKPWSSA